MTQAFVRSERFDDGVVVMTIDRADSFNAIATAEQARSFAETLSALEADATCRVIVLTGAGTAFCAGGDLRAMQAASGMFAKPLLDIRDAYRHGIQTLCRTMMALEVPIIAAVNGPAYGAGCDLACLCDIRIAAERASFAESFVKLGVIPGDGGAWLLQRIVGVSKAMQMSLTGEPVDAREALSIGLVSSVVPVDDLMPTALALARRIARNPPRATRLTKRLIRQAQASSFDATLELSAALQALCHDTDDHRIAIDAFIDRTEAAYTGH